MSNDTQVLFTLEDRLLAEEVQQYLDGFKVYTMIVTDNPTSSALNAFMGSRPAEGLSVVVNQLDYEKAVEIMKASPYQKLLA